MKVLVAETDEKLKKSLIDVLWAGGYEAVCVPDGFTAWKNLLWEGADICVLNTDLPGIDGFGLLRMIRRSELFSGMPVLMLTARNTAEAQAAGYDQGCDDCVVVPVDEHVFLARIKTLERRILKKMKL